MKAHIVERLVPVEIAGTKYHFNFSVAAAKELAPLADVLESKEELEALDDVVKIFEILIEQGARYLDITEKGEKHPRITAEELGILLNTNEALALKDKMFEAVQAGSSREVEIASKNGDAAQGQ